MSEHKYTIESIQHEMSYLQLLSRSFRNSAEASTEIINLEAILNLPKSTEHFLADIHGEHEAFQHVLKNASGDIKRKVREVLSDELSDKDMRTLRTLIYYPAEKLALIKAEQGEECMLDWYALTLRRLISVCQNMSSKYTRSKVRKMLPKNFAYIIEELLYESSLENDRSKYFQSIVNAIIIPVTIPVEIEGSEFVLDVDTVVMSIGTSPNPLIKSTTEGLEVNSRGGIIVEESTGATSKGCNTPY